MSKTNFNWAPLNLIITEQKCPIYFMFTCNLFFFLTSQAIALAETATNEPSPTSYGKNNDNNTISVRGSKFLFVSFMYFSTFIEKSLTNTTNALVKAVG